MRILPFYIHQLGFLINLEIIISKDYSVRRLYLANCENIVAEIEWAVVVSSNTKNRYEII